MSLKLTRHVQDMISYRGLEINHIKSAIKNPDLEEDAYDGKTRVQKTFGNRKIEVIYCKEAFKDRKDEYLVITAYYI